MNSGRGRGSYRGSRGGRGSGRSSGRSNSSNYRGSRSSNSSSSKVLKREMKFSPQTTGKTQYETYATVKETIAMHVQKSYKNGLDIAKAIKDMKHVDMTAQEPTRRISAKPKTEDAAIEQAGLDIKYQEELRRHLDHVATRRIAPKPTH